MAPEHIAYGAVDEPFGKKCVYGVIMEPGKINLMSPGLGRFLAEKKPDIHPHLGKLKVLINVFSALDCLAKNDFTWGAAKPENVILMNDNLDVKLIGLDGGEFGASKYYRGKSTLLPPEFAANGLVKQPPGTFDVWIMSCAIADIMLGLDEVCRAFGQNAAQARTKYADDLTEESFRPYGMDLNLVFTFASLPKGTIVGNCKGHEEEATEAITALTQLHEYVFTAGSRQSIDEVRYCRFTAKQVHDTLRLIYAKADASKQPKADESAHAEAEQAKEKAEAEKAKAEKVKAKAEAKAEKAKAKAKAKKAKAKAEAEAEEKAKAKAKKRRNQQAAEKDWDDVDDIEREPEDWGDDDDDDDD